MYINYIWSAKQFTFAYMTSSFGHSIVAVASSKALFGIMYCPGIKRRVQCPNSKEGLKRAIWIWGWLAFPCFAMHLPSSPDLKLPKN